MYHTKAPLRVRLLSSQVRNVISFLRHNCDLRKVRDSRTLVCLTNPGLLAPDNRSYHLSAELCIWERPRRMNDMGFT